MQNKIFKRPYLKKGFLVICSVVCVSIILFVWLNNGEIVSATSGACSSHLGVDCNAGPDLDGSVICHDGWLDSSVLYSNSAACFPTSLITEYCGKLPSAVSAEITKEMVKKWVGNPYNLEYLEIKEEYEDFLYESNNYGYDVKMSIEGSYLSKMTDALTLSNQYLEDLQYEWAMTCMEAYVNLDSDEMICGINTVNEGDTCVCLKGYIWSINGVDCVKTNVVDEDSKPVNQSFGMEEDVPINPFKDVSPTYVYREAIMYLYDKGVVQGVTNQYFMPDMTINRAEFAKIIMKASGKKMTGVACFSDVNDEWFASYVCGAKKENVIGGYPDGSFKPDKSVNVVEALKMILQAYNIKIRLSELGDEWYERYVQYAKMNNLWLSEFNDPGQALTRGEMAQLLYNLDNRS